MMKKADGSDPYLLGAYTILEKRNNCNVSDLA